MTEPHPYAELELLLAAIDTLDDAICQVRVIQQSCEGYEHQRLEYAAMFAETSMQWLDSMIDSDDEAAYRRAMGGGAQ